MYLFVDLIPNRIIRSEIRGDILKETSLVFLLLQCVFAMQILIIFFLQIIIIISFKIDFNFVQY